MVKAENSAPNGEGEEIDRIMKEIEDLEKKMDDEPGAEQVASGGESNVAQGSNVVPMRSGMDAMANSSVESLAETDAVPAPDEPLFKDATAADGGLSLKIGGCADVSLEFTRAGMSVTLSCTDDGLTITTDQGAEFRIPFKRGA